MTTPAPRPQNAQEGTGSAAHRETPPARPAAPLTAAQEAGTVTAEQRAHLSTHAKRGRATTTQARSFLWGAMLGAKAPVGTKELSQAQAQRLIAQLQTMTGDEIDATVIAGFNLFDDDLPF